MSWLDDLLDQTKEYESPKQFFEWAGLATISAVVKDNVWIERAGGLKLYLNIYVLLYANSGMRKGEPISLAKRLVKKINNTRVIWGRSSVEAIIEDLKEAQTLLDKNNKPIIIADSCGFITASEFSSAIVHSEFALNVLTDLYDRKYNEGDFNIRLIRSGKQTLKNPTITMLGGINEAHFQHFLREKDISGGFLGRTHIIHADKKNTINSLMFDMQQSVDEEKLSEHLLLISKQKGPMSIEHSGKMLYDQWYREFYNQISDDKTGTYERVGDSALKVAALLSLADSTELIIGQKHIGRGIEAAEKLTGAVKQVTYTIGEEQTLSTIKKKILKMLVKKEDHKLTRRKILEDLHGVINLEDFNKIIETLEHAGLVNCVLIGDNVIITMPDEKVKLLKGVIGG